jgi:hypothetical protein
MLLERRFKQIRRIAEMTIGVAGVHIEIVCESKPTSFLQAISKPFAYVYRQRGADHYESIGKMPMRAGAGTSFWSSTLSWYYVVAPANVDQDAAILVCAAQE